MLLVQHSDPEDPFTDCNGETTEYAYILNECTNIGGGEYSVFSCDDESIQETIYTDSECSGAVVSEHDFYHTSMEDCASIQCPTSLTGPTLPATDAMDDEPTTTTTTTSTTDLSCAAVIDEGLPRWPLGSCFTTSEKTSEQFVCHQDGSLIHKKWQTHDCSGSAVMELKEMDGLGYWPSVVTPYGYSTCYGCRGKRSAEPGYLGLGYGYGYGIGGVSRGVGLHPTGSVYESRSAQGLGKRYLYQAIIIIVV